jgi:hypothetical protein
MPILVPSALHRISSADSDSSVTGILCAAGARKGRQQRGGRRGAGRGELAAAGRGREWARHGMRGPCASGGDAGEGRPSASAAGGSGAE